jgi:membrane associated rhomboid family serine protease
MRGAVSRKKSREMMDVGVPTFPKGIRALVIATVAVWVVQIIPGAGSALSGWFDLLPYQTFGHFQLWRLFTYLFLHDPNGPFHLVFNMLTLWMFGAELEELWGTRRFVVFYLAAGAASGLLSLLTVFSPVMWFTPVIGASGAVLALLTVYALYFPRRQILLFFLFPVNVIAAVIIFGAISLVGAMQSRGSVSHLTHLGGIAAGFLYVKWFPVINNFLENAKARVETARRNAEQRKKNADSELYESVIDPILKKISEQGMDSLTPEERRLLEEPSKRKRKGPDDSEKILPFKRPR